jgi:hypothetical protein
MRENARTRVPLVPNGFTILTALFHRPSERRRRERYCDPRYLIEQKKKGGGVVKRTRKEPRKRHRGAQALDSRVHVARIPQILQANRSNPPVRPVRHRVF